MQPTYLPWIGFFDLMDQVDIFVYLDDVQFSKQSWQQRNRIKTAKGLEWLTVPVLLKNRSGQLIRNVEFSQPDFWKKHLRTIQLNYSRAPFFKDFFNGISDVFEKGSPWANLADLNIALIEHFRQALKISTSTVRASEFSGIESLRGERVAELCSKLGVKHYVSPIGAKEYLEQDMLFFKNKNISVSYQNYEHPQYPQLHGEFADFASVVDLVLNCGEESIDILRKGRGAE